jgi:hypothetical protein
MNLPIATVKAAAPMAWHLMVESLADGQVAAWVAELPDCRVVAESRDAAMTSGRSETIAQLEPLVDERMAMIDAVEFYLPIHATPQPHPLDDVPSIDKDDPAFIEFMATLRADRELDDDNPAYTINW